MKSCCVGIPWSRGIAAVVIGVGACAAVTSAHPSQSKVARRKPQLALTLVQVLERITGKINATSEINRFYGDRIGNASRNRRASEDAGSRFAYSCRVLSADKDTFILSERAFHVSVPLSSLNPDEADVRTKTTFHLSDLDPYSLRVTYDPEEKWYRVSAAAKSHKALIKTEIRSLYPPNPPIKNPERATLACGFDIRFENKAVAQQVATLLKRAVLLCDASSTL